MAGQRVCVTCGAAFRWTTYRKCTACRAKERTCTTCGETFRGLPGRCGHCRSTQQTCPICGRKHRSSNRVCRPCMRRERVCTKCGAAFVGWETKCYPCRNVERVCVDCGKVSRSPMAQCFRCQHVALDPAVRSSRARAQNNSKRGGGTKPLPAAVYRAAWADECVYCGGVAAEMDHIWARRRGGSEAEGNLVPACVNCNQAKRSLLLTEWDPVRVAHGAAKSPKVAAELARLTAENTPSATKPTRSRSTRRS